MYAKVFTSILDSSINSNYQVRHVFEDFLKLADPDGVVDMTPEAIARRTNVPLDIVLFGIAELEKPDPSSRNMVEEGRRLIRLDPHRTWGWQIVNYKHYRAITSEVQKRELTRQRVARHRNKALLVTPSNADGVTGNDGSVKCNAMKKEKEKKIQKETTKKSPPAPVEVPKLLADSPAFMEAWADWTEYRKQLKKPMTPLSQKQALADCLNWGPTRATAAIRYTIGKGWIGIYEERMNGNGPSSARSKDPTAYDSGTFADELTAVYAEKRKAREDAARLAAERGASVSVEYDPSAEMEFNSTGIPC